MAKGVYFDVAYDAPQGRKTGRINFNLYDDVVPKTTKNFRALCTGGKSYLKAPTSNLLRDHGTNDLAS